MPTVHHLDPAQAAQWRRDIERLTSAPWAETTAALIALAYRHLPAALLDAIAQLNDPGRPREALYTTSRPKATTSTNSC